MSWLDRIDDQYQSLIEPPAGYTLVTTQVLKDSITGPDATDRLIRRELGLDEDFTLGGAIVFRTIVMCPDGETKYTSAHLDSLAVLCKKEFWEEFWDAVQELP